MEALRLGLVQQSSMATAPAEVHAVDTEAVYRDHAATVARCLRRLGVRPEDRDDVLQDVFVVVHRNRARFLGLSSVGTWVYGIAVRVAIAHLRRTRGRAERVRTDLEPPTPSTEPDPQGALEQRDAATVLDGLLAELDDDKRAVFVLSELEDVPVPRIAEALALNVRTTYSRLRAARADFDRGWVRWQARAARIERRVPVRDLARRTGEERVPAWSTIAIGLHAPTTSLATTVGATSGAAIGGTTWAAIGIATILAVIGTDAALARDAPSKAPVVTTAAETGAPSRSAIAPAAADAPRVSPPEALAPIPTPITAPPVDQAPAAAPTRAAAAKPAIAPTSDLGPTTNAPLPGSSATPTAEPLALLRDARSAIRRGDAAAAMVALREHERLAPTSELAIERETLWVEAACAAGDRDTAREHAERWAKHTSGSAQTLLSERCR